jgi:hypothetical protein
MQKTCKESCETTCKQHSKTSIERDHFVSRESYKTTWEKNS